MIVAMIALFVALSGTAVATTSALIGGAQIRNNSITGADIKNKSLRPIDFRGSVRGARGVRGLAGQPGPPGATGAAGAAGAKGDKGDKGEDLTFTTTLKSAQTLTGVYSAGGGAAGEILGATIEFRPNLPANIPAANVHYVTPSTPNANCPGAGQAAAGHLCIYEIWINNATFTVWTDPYSAGGVGGPITPEGVGLYWTSTGATSNTRGRWAVQPAASATAAGTMQNRGAPSAFGS